MANIESHQRVQESHAGRRRLRGKVFSHLAAVAAGASILPSLGGASSRPVNPCPPAPKPKTPQALETYSIQHRQKVHYDASHGIPTAEGTYTTPLYRDVNGKRLWFTVIPHGKDIRRATARELTPTGQPVDESWSNVLKNPKAVPISSLGRVAIVAGNLPAENVTFSDGEQFFAQVGALQPNSTSTTNARIRYIHMAAATRAEHPSVPVPLQ